MEINKPEEYTDADMYDQIEVPDDYLEVDLGSLEGVGMVECFLIDALGLKKREPS